MKVFRYAKCNSCNGLNDFRFYTTMAQRCRNCSSGNLTVLTSEAWHANLASIGVVSFLTKLAKSRGGV